MEDPTPPHRSWARPGPKPGPRPSCAHRVCTGEEGYVRGVVLQKGWGWVSVGVCQAVDVRGVLPNVVHLRVTFVWTKSQSEPNN